jgi:CRISPR-associated RAMP protein (TIGR02581 family)
MTPPSLYAHASFEAFRNRLRVTGELVSQTALRIGAGRDTDVVGNDLPVLRDGQDRPFIPGASLKGAFRARLESLVRAVAPGQALDLEQLEARTRTDIAKLKERDLSDEQLSERIWQRSTLIDLTFGSPELAGRLFFKDALVQEDVWFDQFEIRNGVVLNRDTETAEEGLLYDYEVVPAGTRFDFHLILEQAADWQLGMVMLALRPWERGDVQIGGFRSRGLGYVKLDNLVCTYHTVETVDDIVALLDPPSGDQQHVTPDQQHAWIDTFVTTLKHLAGEQTHA